MSETPPLSPPEGWEEEELAGDDPSIETTTGTGTAVADEDDAAAERAIEGALDEASVRTFPVDDLHLDDAFVAGYSPLPKIVPKPPNPDSPPPKPYERAKYSGRQRPKFEGGYKTTSQEKKKKLEAKKRHGKPTVGSMFMVATLVAVSLIAISMCDVCFIQDDYVTRVAKGRRDHDDGSGGSGGGGSVGGGGVAV
jgi:hypothetical protein